MGTARTLAILILALAGRPAAAGGEERPFPVERTTILREEGIVYTVSGRVKIPSGVEVTCLKDVMIRGVGEGAVIEVEGALKVHGVGAREVIFENVVIEPASSFGDIQMDMAIFREGAALRTPEGESVEGKLVVELVEFRGDSRLDVTFRGGDVDLSSVCSDAQVRVRAVDPDEKTENRVKVHVRGCIQADVHLGLVGGLVVEGASDVTIRTNRLGGAESVFRDCRSLAFDGNKVDSRVLEFAVGQNGDFRRTKVTKCDIYSETVRVRSAPTSKKTRDAILFDRCWFRGEEDPRVVREKVLEDGAEDAANAGWIRLGKLGSRPLELAGKWSR